MTTVRTLVLGLAIVSGALPISVAAAQTVTAAPARKVTITIAAQPLGKALNEWASQTGYQVLLPSRSATGGRMAPALTGSFTPEAALQQLLLNSGLKYEFIDARTVSISTAAKGESASKVRLGEQMRLAMAAAETQTVPISRSSSQEVVVEGERDKVAPFRDANVDLPRTIDDVKPYYIFDSETLDTSGAQSVEEFLTYRLPMSTNGYGYTDLRADSVVGAMRGSSQFSMRGLSTDETLVLINGSPIPDTPSETAASTAQGDLNGIPLSAIERIEVLPSSASGIYGGGAVGGVINVILKSNRPPSIEAKVNYDNTFKTDAARRRAELSSSFSLEGGKTQVLLTGSFSDANALLVKDRLREILPGYHRVYENSPYYSLQVPPLGATPNIYTAVASGLTLKSGESLNGARITHLPVGYRGFAIDGAAPLIANAGQFNMELANSANTDFGLLAPIGSTPAARSGMFTVRRQMNSRVEMFVDGAYTSRRTSDNISRLYELTIQPTSPTNPFNQAVKIYAPDAFTMHQEYLSQTRRIRGGLRVRLGAGWQLQADHSWSDSRVNYNRESSDTVARDADIASGALNLFVDTLMYPIDWTQYLRYDAYDSASKMLNSAVRASGPVMKLPGGDMTLTTSVIRQARSNPDLHLNSVYPNRPAGDSIRVNPARSNSTLSGYLEASIPLIGKNNRRTGLQLLEVQVAARHERYEVNTIRTAAGAGTYTLTPAAPNPPDLVAGQTEYSSTNPTIGFRFKPIKDVMLRVSWSTAFRPPSYSQLQEPLRSANQSTAIDPQRGDEQVRVYTLSGGNPDLEPESARNWVVGLVLTPRHIPKLRVAFDYTRIKKVNNVSSLGLQAIVNREDEFPGRVVRDEPVPGDGFTVGPIVEVYTNPLNLLGSLTETLDASVSYNMNTARLGNFNASFIATKLMRALQRQTETTSLDFVGVQTGIGSLEYRANANLNWNRQRWSAGWNMTYYGPYHVNGPPWSVQTAWALAMGDSPWIPSQTYHDVFAGYTVPTSAGMAGRLGWMNGTQIQMGIKNVFNEPPAFDASTAMSGMYVGTFGSLRMRSYWVSLKKSF